MAGGEIVPAAQRGVIDCAEWVGGVEDLRLGLPGVFKYHYTPGMHENNSIGEFGLHLDVWKGFTPQQQEAINSAIKDTFITWNTRWQRQNADAIEEMIKKHGVQVRRTPPDILIASLKAWDEVAAEHSAKNPTFKKVYESQREYASKVVPAKRYMHPPYSFAANYYWPQEGAGAPRQRRRESNSDKVGGWPERRNPPLADQPGTGRHRNAPGPGARGGRSRRDSPTSSPYSRTSPTHGRARSSAPTSSPRSAGCRRRPAPGAHEPARDGGDEPEEPRT